MATGTIPMNSAAYFRVNPCPADLNDVEITGIYTWANGSKTNAPTATGYGALLHIQTATVRAQTMWALADNNVYYRTKAGSNAWTGWKLISASAVVV